MSKWDGKERRQLGSIDTMLIQMNEKVDYLVFSHKELSKTVYGNGKVEEGLVWKVQQHQNDRKGMIKFGWILLTGFGIAISVPLFQWVAGLPKH